VPSFSCRLVPSLVGWLVPSFHCRLVPSLGWLPGAVTDCFDRPVAVLAGATVLLVAGAVTDCFD
jgi:hypothetical protein